MGIAADVTRIKSNITAALAAIADKGVDVPDGSTSDALAGLIASIEAGGGTSIEPVKAFYPNPISNEVLVKNIVPVVNIALASYAYTVTNETIGVSFTFGDAGTTYILALATRIPSAEPTLPDGWEKCAWVEPDASAPTKQYLLVAKHTTTNDDAGTTCDISFDVTKGQRHYIMVVSVGDSDISTNDVMVNAYTSVASISPEVYENTILICSSASASSYTSAVPWKLNSGYAERIEPNYNDGSTAGGRLGALYIPFLSEQPYNKPEIWITGNNDTSTLVCVCALKLLIGTTSKYVAQL
ncbi:MAG: hypothetical protein ACI4PC_10005 [Oscillospiraceae bacterium]